MNDNTQGVENFHVRLKSAMKMNGESVNSLAKRIGISEGSIRNLVKGSYPRLDTFIALANGLNVTVEWLATGKHLNAPAKIELKPFQQVVETLTRDNSALKEEPFESLLDHVSLLYSSTIEIANEVERQELLDKMLAVSNLSFAAAKK